MEKIQDSTQAMAQTVISAEDLKALLFLTLRGGVKSGTEKATGTAPVKEGLDTTA